MHKLRTLKFGTLCLLVALVACATIVYALSYTENRELLLTTSFKLEGGEQRFTAFYLPAPATAFEVKFKVSSGTVKYSPWHAGLFEENQGYHVKYVNGTAVDKFQIWMFDVGNESIGHGICPPYDVNKVWYLHFYNEDSYEKEVYIEVTKMWESQNYQDWI
jgi:hypothetical protein